MGGASESNQVPAQTIQVGKEQIYKGNLVLINKDYPVHPGSVETDIVNLSERKELLSGFGLLNDKIRLPSNVLQKFTEMVYDAGKEGVNHFIISSGYRDRAEQNELYKEMGADYALPAGHSEHNLGLSLDIGSTLQAMNEAPEGEWLMNHAPDYGFILRYPKDKTAITGIQYEPWHFRYVGLPHSKIMQEKQFALEEYLAFLKERKSILATVNGERFEVRYIPISQDESIQVPVNHPYELSGDNGDGVILTVHLDS
ncbi:D-Ala-D-Ala carboxypeptidase VanY [Paenibacillus montanisoli]|uniref:D-Ala-D-Ala carboxypeptidase VanY n=2 Tax=Paenibacillus montanisoli TaxID=2081970 RepID=A0A328U9X7_9BACL|nr:D-Ala-D-Ala carboxypeptidase VanY [Paenibacillus montanisoli]